MTTMKRPLPYILALAAAQSANAFIPSGHQSNTLKVSTTTTRRRDFSKKHVVLNEPTDSSKPGNPEEASVGTASLIEVDGMTVASVDRFTQFDREESKAILLESISRTDPMDVLSEVEDSVSEYVNSIFADTIGATGDHSKPDGKDEDASSALPDSILSSMNLDLTGEIGTPNSGIDNSRLTVNEDVKAILEASGEAVTAAEAILPPELAERLQLLGANSVNGTTQTIWDLQDLNPTPQISEEERSTEHSVSPYSMVNELNLPEILPASQIVGEPVTRKLDAPSVRKILKFAIPAIGVWLCGPLLSLIDTSAVGVFSGTVQQAALNPAVAVTDYTALLIAFMYTGTTNMVAAAQESDRGTVDKPRTAKTMIGAMQMSTVVGTSLGAILFVFARPLLKAIIGNDAISPAVFAAAMRYVRIRALGMPAAAIIGSTQAACLGMQDVRSPLYVLAAAAVVNFLGDVLFVGNSHPLIGGAAGAAWATVISQYVAVAFFVRWLCSKPDKVTNQPRVLNLSNAILEMTSKSGSNAGQSRRQRLQDTIENFRKPQREKSNPHGLEQRKKKIGTVVGKLFSWKKASAKKSNLAKPVQPNNDSFSTRGFLKGRFSPMDLAKFPSEETRQQFAPYVVPVTTTQLGKVSGYVAMSHVVASSMGTISMAAQQVIVSLFYCLTPIADSLSLTAQSLVPAIAERKASLEKSAALKMTVRSFLKAGVVFGCAMMAAVSAIPLLTGFFTSDPAVIGLVNSVVPLLLVFFGLHGFVCGMDGLLLGQKDLSFLGKMYAIFFGAVPWLMLRVKRAALTGSHPVNITSVWKVFVGYQAFRCVAWFVRSAFLQKRNDIDAALADPSLIDP